MAAGTRRIPLSALGKSDRSLAHGVQPLGPCHSFGEISITLDMSMTQ